MLIKIIAQSADAGPGGWVGLKRKLLHLDVDGSGAVNAEGKLLAIRALPFCCCVLLWYTQLLEYNEQLLNDSCCCTNAASCQA